MVDQNDLNLEIQAKLDKICNGMDVMSDKQETMSVDIAKIKEAVYNPDQGLYARVRDLEQWQQSVAKFIWTVGLAVTGLIIQAIYSNLF